MKRGLSDPIYKEKGNRWARKMRRPKKLFSHSDASIFGMVFKDKNLLRYVGYCAKLMAGDVMAVFRNFQETMSWRVTMSRKSKQRRIIKVLKIDMNKFKSTWGLMLGI